jgi:hypothetical protein
MHVGLAPVKLRLRRTTGNPTGPTAAAAAQAHAFAGACRFTSIVSLCRRPNCEITRKYEAAIGDVLIGHRLV